MKSISFILCSFMILLYNAEAAASYEKGSTFLEDDLFMQEVNVFPQMLLIHEN